MHNVLDFKKKKKPKTRTQPHYPNRPYLSECVSNEYRGSHMLQECFIVGFI